MRNPNPECSIAAVYTLGVGATRVRLPALRPIQTFSMTKIYYKAVREHRLVELADFKVGSWIYAENPTQDELDSLARNLSLNRDLLGDSIDPYEVPRVERDNAITYVFTRVPHAEALQTTTTPLLIAIGADFVLTVSRSPLPFLTKFQEEKIEFYTTQKTKFFLQLFSEINNIYAFFVNDIARKVRSITVRLESIGNKEVKQFVVFESSLNDFLAALIPMNTSLSNLLSGKFLQLYEQDHELVQDLVLSNHQLVELCQSNMKSIGNIREGYSAILTNELSRVIKFLTSLTVILTIPITITAFYSMNVRLPFGESPVAFYTIVSAVLLIALTLLVVFFKKRWL